MEGRHPAPQLGEVCLLSRATIWPRPIELHFYVPNARALGYLPDEVNQVHCIPARQIDRIAVGCALGGQAEAKREIASVEEVSHLPAGPPHHHRTVSVQHLL